MNQNIVALSVGVHRDHLHSHKIYQDGHKTRIYTLARNLRGRKHGLRTVGEEIAFTARPKIKSQSQILRYGRSIFCLPHRPNFSDLLELCLYWVSVVCVHNVEYCCYDNVVCAFEVVSLSER